MDLDLNTKSYFCKYENVNTVTVAISLFNCVQLYEISPYEIDTNRSLPLFAIDHGDHFRENPQDGVYLY